MERKSLLTCSYNTRELGGMRTADGRATKYGVIWRSDTLSTPTAEDAEKLRELNITTIIDMRTEAECKNNPDGFADMDGFDYHHLPITEGSGVPESLEAVPYSYMDIATADNMHNVWRTIAEAESGILFHCTAGKDRTGVVSAIILMACGVDEESIVHDYVISREYNKERLASFLAAHPEVDKNIVLANEKSMKGFMRLFNERFGTVDGYFEAIGLTAAHADMIRNKLIGTDEFTEKFSAFLGDFGIGRTMVLSTSENDRVSSRMMSVVRIGEEFYFQTDTELRKYRQLITNNNAALCIDNIQIEGVCKEKGHPTDSVDFCEVFCSCFRGSYDAYSKLENERLFVFRPTYIQRWIYKDGVPYIERFELSDRKYSIDKYTGIYENRGDRL
ncbi:MAG TPA: tyrosine-protein phosphatase [Ruminococcus flavefaciens]|nr:tyrosine-protein phosphatase [Ruminococcus flavefaciens]